MISCIYMVASKLHRKPHKFCEFGITKTINAFTHLSTQSTSAFHRHHNKTKVSSFVYIDLSHIYIYKFITFRAMLPYRNRQPPHNNLYIYTRIRTICDAKAHTLILTVLVHVVLYVWVWLCSCCAASSSRWKSVTSGITVCSAAPPS